CVWGRGAIDDKLSHISILQAVEELLKEGVAPERTLYFCFGGDEEIGGTEGARSIVRWLRERGESLAWVLDEGGAVTEGALPGLRVPTAMVGLAEKGHVNLRLTARGAGGHAASPPRETAISSLARGIRRLVKSPFPTRITGTVDAFLSALAPHLTGALALLLRLRPLTNPLILAALRKNPRTRAMVETTQAVTMVSGGSAENVLPDSASAVVNIRLLHGDTIEFALAHVREAINDPEISVELHGEWGNNGAIPETPVDHPLLAVIQDALESVLPGVPLLPYLPTGSTDSAAYSELTPNIFRFVPMLLSAKDLSLVHNIDERISVENVELCFGFYKSFIRTAGGRESDL
ncbi:MAG: M20/M25/M40 family metallo-hydrolase, partial [Alkalispirochaetaceae bacterium]